jgi:hypothetical protein
MRRDRLHEEKLLVNGQIGGETLSRQERKTLQDETAEWKQLTENAKDKPVAE